MNRRRVAAVRMFAGTALMAMAWRPAGAAAAAATFQPGQSVEVREGDTWSSATVLKREGRKYQVHYANSDASTDEWVAPDRIRLPGGATPPPAAPVPDAPAASTPKSDDATPPAAPVHRPSVKKLGGMFPEPDEVMDVTEANRSAVEVDQPAERPAAWGVVPDGPAKVSPPWSYALRTRGTPGHEMSPKQLLPCAGGGAVVGFGDFFDKARAVERVGAGPAVRASLPPQSFPLAASPDGSLLVCRCNAFGFGNNARIDAFTLTPGASEATPLVSFKPYPDEGNDGKGEDVRFAAALSNARIVTCDLKGRLIAWDIAAGSVTGVWRVDVGGMAFGGDLTALVAVSPGGKWLAAAGKGGVTFVEATTGRVLGVIDVGRDASVHDLACSPTGKTLIARGGDGGTLVSFDLTTGKAIREVALPSYGGGRTACPDDGFALLDGRTLLSTSTGAVVTQFQPTDATLAATGPGVTLLASKAKVSAVHLPDAAVKAAVAAEGDAALALKPGAAVAVDIDLPGVSDGDRAAVDAAVRRQLADDGFVVIPSAETVVVCRTELGDRHEHVYGKTSSRMPFMRMLPPGGGESMVLTDKVTRLTIVRDGQTIWERKRVCGPANSVPYKEGESIEDTVKATIQYDPKFLMGLKIPRYIAGPAGDDEHVTPPKRPNRIRPSGVGV